MEMTVFGVSLVAYLMFGFSLCTWVYMFVRGRKRRGFRPIQSARQMVMARARWKFAY